jgi:hypothetical protein
MVSLTDLPRDVLRRIVGCTHDAGDAFRLGACSREAREVVAELIAPLRLPDLAIKTAWRSEENRSHAATPANLERVAAAPKGALLCVPCLRCHRIVPATLDMGYVVHACVRQGQLREWPIPVNAPQTVTYLGTLDAPMVAPTLKWSRCTHKWTLCALDPGPSQMPTSDQ